MKPPASFSALGSEFDAFLFAAIGEDRNAMPVSVVSALARMNLDPWHEAGSLAAMSVEAATAKLTSLLAALPDASLKRLDPPTLAARLIAFLPQRPDSDARSSAAGAGTVVATRPRPRLNVIVLAIYVIVMLGTQFVAMRLSPPTHADPAHASAPPAAAPHPPPTASRK